MKNISAKAWMIVFLVGLPGAAHAEDFKPYIGLGTGIYSIGFKLSDPLTSSMSQRKQTWGGFVKAGIDVLDYFGAEVRLGSTGNPSTSWGAGLPVGYGAVTTVTSTVSSQINYFFSYLGKLQYPFNDSFKVYGLAGGTMAKYTASWSATGSENATVTGFSYGGGLEYAFANRYSLGLEWMEYLKDVTISSAGSTDTGSFRGISATLNMAF